MNETQPNRPSFVQQLDRLYPVVEVICVALLLTALITQPAWRNEMLTLSLVTLAGVFFLRSFSPPKNRPEKTAGAGLFYQTMLPKLMGIGSSVCLIGFLFYILHLHGADQMLLIGTATLAGCLAASAAAAVKSPAVFPSLLPLVLRVVLVAGLGAYGLYRLNFFN